MNRVSVHWLVAALAMMFTSTVVLALILGRVAVVEHRANGDIARRVAPSIVSLQTISVELRRLDIVLRERATDEPADRPARDARIARARGELAAGENAYLALSHAPDNEPIQEAIAASLGDVDHVVGRWLALPPDTSAPAALIADLDGAYVKAQTDVARATESEAAFAETAASRASVASRLLLPSAITLEALTFVAAAVAITLTARAIRRAEAIAEQGRLSLERRAEELEAFAGRVAHDLLSPLMTVGLALDLAQRRSRGAAADASTRSALDRASSTLQRVRAFVTDLLDFARAGAHPPPGVRAQVADVVRDVADQFEPIARESHVDLRVEPVAPREVRCSPGVLTSLLTNLVQNAIKYVADSPERRVVVRELDTDGQVRVEVEDTGPGISSAEQQRLFEPFVRGHGATRAAGIGLGLATVRRLAEAHGGRFGVRSEPGKGSVFWFSVPAAEG